MRCAKCGKAIDQRHAVWFGPASTVKCQLCGPWTLREQAQIIARLKAARPCPCDGVRR